MRLQGPGFRVELWTPDPGPARARLSATLARRGAPLPPQRARLDGRLQTLGEAALFENQDFEIELLGPVAGVRHPSESVEQRFRSCSTGLRGRLNPGNDVGWFSFEVELEDGSRCRVELEVHPTKLDMEQDLQRVGEDLDALYPMWRYAFWRQTEQDASASRGRPLPLMWLRHFVRLRQELEDQVQRICNAPRHRLRSTSHPTSLHQLRGRLRPRTEEQVGEAVRAGADLARVRVQQRTVSLDTPENRFVKEALRDCDRSLARIQAVLAGHASESFREDVDGWRRSMRRLLAHPLWRSVGPWTGHRSESLLLQQGAGYSGVYRVWVQLRRLLVTLGQQSRVAVRGVARLYELWCVVELRRTLLGLGFEELDRPLTVRPGPLQQRLSDLPFRFRRGASIVDLLHEPFYAGRDPMLPGQRPDIVLQRGRERWVFDAKYRVSDDGLAPEPTLNEMHRYRDAIRGVRSAVVLYPGPLDQTGPNPYAGALQRGVGALPLLPGSENPWLDQWLEAALSEEPDAPYPGV